MTTRRIVPETKHNATGSDDEMQGNVTTQQGRGNKTQRQNTTTNQTKRERWELKTLREVETRREAEMQRKAETRREAEMQQKLGGLRNTTANQRRLPRRKVETV